jgi:hypothetical protein
VTAGDGQDQGGDAQDGHCAGADQHDLQPGRDGGTSLHDPQPTTVGALLLRAKDGALGLAVVRRPQLTWRRVNPQPPAESSSQQSTRSYTVAVRSSTMTTTTAPTAAPSFEVSGS